jgi:hypothetical protein
MKARTATAAPVSATHPAGTTSKDSLCADIAEIRQKPLQAVVAKL